MSNISSYEGRQEHIRRLKTPPLEVFNNKYQDKDYTVKLEYPAFTTYSNLLKFFIYFINEFKDLFTFF